MSDKPRHNYARKLLGVIVILLAGIVYGHFATVNEWPISKRLDFIRGSFSDVIENSKRPILMAIPNRGISLENIAPDRLAPGLVMLAGLGPDYRNFIRVVDRNGTIIHEWKPGWFDIWGKDREGFDPVRLPQSDPGAVLHGVEILPNGDFLVNFEHLSTLRATPCGDVVWKLKNHGHHFVHIADDDTIWVGSDRTITNGETGYQNHNAPLNSWAIQQLSMDGKIIQTVEVIDILRENDLLGLLHMSALGDETTVVSGDTTHLNDVDIFPEHMESQVFSPGDIMISLRNINTVIVVDPVNFKVKFQATGNFLRQHDADFAPGDKILVYDNRNLSLPGEPYATQGWLQSRIVELDARTGKSRVAFQGEGKSRFYSVIMGRQQLLENGNLMIVSPVEGRAMEVSPNGDLLWQIFNVLDENYYGLMSEAHVLPQFMDKEFFESRRANCRN